MPPPLATSIMLAGLLLSPQAISSIGMLGFPLLGNQEERLDMQVDIRIPEPKLWVLHWFAIAGLMDRTSRADAGKD